MGRRVLNKNKSKLNFSYIFQYSEKKKKKTTPKNHHQQTPNNKRVLKNTGTGRAWSFGCPSISLVIFCWTGTERGGSNFFLLVGYFAGLQCCSEYECVSLGKNWTEFLLSLKANSWYTFFLFQYILFYLIGSVNNNSLTCTCEQHLFE